MNPKQSDRTSVLGILFRSEIKRLMREARVLLISVFAPLVIVPGYILVMQWIGNSEEQRIEDTVYEYALSGDETEWGLEIVSAALALEANDPDTSQALVRFERQQVTNTDSLLQAGEIHLVIEALSPEAYERSRAEEIAADTLDPEEDEVAPEIEEGSDGGTAPELQLPIIRLRFRGNSDFSRRAHDRLDARIREVRSELRDSVYLAGGFPVGREEFASVETENTASAEKEGGALLGMAVTPFLLLLMLSGGSIMAVDAITGEKERGTLETLLTSAASRSEIVAAKQMGIIAVGVVVVVINVLNLLAYLVLGLLELPENLAVALSPLDLVLILILFLPLTVLISSTLLLISGYAKSYKEYQIYFFPLFLVFLVPSLAGILPGLDLRSAIALVPIDGVGVAVREIMVA